MIPGPEQEFEFSHSFSRPETQYVLIEAFTCKIATVTIYSSSG